MSALPSWCVPDDAADKGMHLVDAFLDAGDDWDLPCEWAGDIEPVLDDLWLVQDVLPQEGLALLIGHPRIGKSSLAIDIGMHVAAGIDWNTRNTRHGTVIYLGAEGQKGLRNRIAAWRKDRGISGSVPFALIPQCLDLFANEEAKAAFRRKVLQGRVRSGCQSRSLLSTPFPRRSERVEKTPMILRHTSGSGRRWRRSWLVASSLSITGQKTASGRSPGVTAACPRRRTQYWWQRAASLENCPSRNSGTGRRGRSVHSTSNPFRSAAILGATTYDPVSWTSNGQTSRKNRSHRYAVPSSASTLK